MSYIVFARKWRPKDFESVLGQEHVVTTLKNAISQNRVAHAYLFSGPRGVGKTTTARIFAMGLNCKNGPTPTPCGSCDSCKETANATNLDVLEIDGASNRGIDEVRTLRENIKFAPSQGKFKVYIIDEVHMLTEEAFNALLKTLEEPPSHVVFIFATTRPYKVPPTILSRCQRFDFKRLTIDEIAGKLKDIAKSEKLEIQEEALYTVVRAAEGSMRDAESMLDQLVSFCGRKIDLESAASILGMIGQEVLFDFTDKVITKDTAGILKLVDRIISGGKDMPQFLNSLIGHFRNLLIAKVGEDPQSLIDLPKESIERISAQANSFTSESLLYILSILANTQDAVRRAISQRIPLELAAIRLTRREDLSSLSSILSRLSEIEKRLEAKGNPHATQPHVQDSRREEKSNPEKNLNLSEEQFTVGVGVKNPLDVSFERICEIWPTLLRGITPKKMSVAIFLQAAQPLKLEERILTIAFARESRFNKEALEANGNRRVIENALNEILNQELRVDFKIVEALEKKVSVEEPLYEEYKEETHEVIKSALDIFGGNLKKKGPA
ncbi:MAG: DNA polymerase III subunit gamma/tau [Candidatus Omnitrophota bacterium]|nr:DNA polymerase III subunit gamma/tau [Candidatus Omnitrophota bacterium]